MQLPDKRNLEPKVLFTPQTAANNETIPITPEKPFRLSPERRKKHQRNGSALAPPVEPNRLSRFS